MSLRGAKRLAVMRWVPAALIIVAIQFSTEPRRAQAETAVDLSGYRQGCEVRVEGWDEHLRISWPMREGERGEVTLNVSGAGPLIQKLATRKAGTEASNIL